MDNSMSLFRVLIVTIDGERSYGDVEYVVALDVEEAEQIAKDNHTSDLPDGYTVEDEWVWDDTGETCSRVSSVVPVSHLYASGKDGAMYEVPLPVLKRVFF